MTGIELHSFVHKDDPDANICPLFSLKLIILIPHVRGFFMSHDLFSIMLPFLLQASSSSVSLPAPNNMPWILHYLIYSVISTRMSFSSTSVIGLNCSSSARKAERLFIKKLNNCILVWGLSKRTESKSVISKICSAASQKVGPLFKSQLDCVECSPCIDLGFIFHVCHTVHVKGWLETLNRPFGAS